MGLIERDPVDAVAEFLHTGGPSLNADDAAVAIIGALTEAGFEVVPAGQLAGAVEALGMGLIERSRPVLPLSVQITTAAIGVEHSGGVGLAAMMRDEWVPLAEQLEGAVAAERERWLRWATRRTCCEAGLIAAPDPCPWHDAPTTSRGQ